MSGTVATLAQLGSIGVAAPEEGWPPGAGVVPGGVSVDGTCAPGGNCAGAGAATGGGGAPGAGTRGPIWPQAATASQTALEAVIRMGRILSGGAV